MPVKLATRAYKPLVSCLQSSTLSVSDFLLIDLTEIYICYILFAMLANDVVPYTSSVPSPYILLIAFEVSVLE